ncbi:dip2/Utp12 family domain-containing protein [Ditylenchus destructor]|uniref:Dip2/Utp12 family domain-containing protein n=1 Tax=Ditylenchus destructor TaxID=166010 RepID=A0AAD4N1B5_9BILA|nr:dip2/Utp12 family domain-containing protein [Ditylenchus destructor]
MINSRMTSSGELLKKIDLEQYYDQFVSEGVYPDGRCTSQFRPFSVEFSVDRAACGSALVQQGGASVSCACNVSVAPYSNEPPIVYDLSWLECIPKKIIEEAELLLKWILAHNYLVDMDSLKVDSSSSEHSFDLRFTLHLNIVAISADGLLTDALLTAVQAAILDATLPAVEYDGKSVLQDTTEIGTDDIALQFEINKVKVLPQQMQIKPKRVELKDFLIYIPFQLYRITTDEKYKVLCDASGEVCTLVKNRCEMVLGKDGTFYSLKFSSPMAFQKEILVESKSVMGRKSRQSLRQPDADGTSASFSILLSQSIQSGDHERVSSIISRTDAQPDMIQRTVDELPVLSVIPFLQMVERAMQEETLENNGNAWMTWLDAVLVTHSSYLSTITDLDKKIGYLNKWIQKRTANLEKLLQLQGKLEVVSQQMTVRSKPEIYARQEPVMEMDA